MAASFAIPTAVRSGFQVWLTLDAEAAARLASTIAQSSYIARASDFRNTLLPYTENQDRATELAQFLMSIVTLHLHRREAISDILAGITEGLSPTSQTKWVTQTQIDEWNIRLPLLTRLVNSASLHLLAKSAILAYEHACVLNDCRIITDLRPVFTQDDSSFPIVVAAQSLHLTLMDSGDLRKISIAMDEADVRKLLTACERALSKLGVVRTALGAAQIHVTVPGSAADE